MEKTYQEQIVSFVMKVIVSLGSVYLITEKFTTEINHLFNFSSIEYATLAFYLIYFVLPIAIFVLFFFLKKSNVAKVGKKANLSFGLLAFLSLILMLLANWIGTPLFIISTYFLSSAAIILIGFCFKFIPSHKRKFLEYIPLAIGILLFSNFYLVRNYDTVIKFENQYFKDKEEHFRIVDLVEDFNSSTTNQFRPEKPAELDTEEIRKYFANQNSDDSIAIEKATSTELIRITENQWGLYINLISFKALLVFLPLLSIVLCIAFLFQALSHEKISDPILIKRRVQDFEVIQPEAQPNTEVEFVKGFLIILVTLTIPLLHPLETITTSFDKPFPTFGGATTSKKYYPLIPSDSKSDNKPIAKADTLYSSIVNVSGYGDLTILSKSKILLNNNQKIKDVDVNLLKTGLENLNNNLVLFSSFFGDENMVKDQNFKSEATGSPAFFYRRSNKLKTSLYEK